MPEPERSAPFEAEATWAPVMPLEEHPWVPEPEPNREEDIVPPVEEEEVPPPPPEEPHHHEHHPRPTTPEYPMIHWNPSFEAPPSTNAHVAMPDLVNFRNAWDMPFDRRATFVPPPVHNDLPPPPHYNPGADHGEIRSVFPWEDHMEERIVSRIWLDEEEAARREEERRWEEMRRIDEERRREEEAMRAAGEVAVGVAAVATIGWDEHHHHHHEEPKKEFAFVNIWDEVPGIRKYLARLRGDEYQGVGEVEKYDDNEDEKFERRASGDLSFVSPRWEYIQGELVETDISEFEETDLYDTSEYEYEEVEIDDTLDDDYDHVSTPTTPTRKRSPILSGIVPYTPGVSDEEWDDRDMIPLPLKRTGRLSMHQKEVAQKLERSRQRSIKQNRGSSIERDGTKKVVRKKKLIKQTVIQGDQGADTAMSKLALRTSQSSQSSSSNESRGREASRPRLPKRAMYALATSSWFGQTPYTSAAASPTGMRSGAQTPGSAPGSPTRNPVDEFRNYKIGWASDLGPAGARSHSRSRSRSRSRSKSIEGVRRRAPSSLGSSRPTSRQPSRDTSPSAPWKQMPKRTSRSTWDPHGALKGLQESGEKLLRKTGQAMRGEEEEEEEEFRDEYQDAWIGVEAEEEDRPRAYYEEEDEDLGVLGLRFPGKKIRAMSPKSPKSPSMLPWGESREIEGMTTQIPASTIKTLKDDLSFLGMQPPTQMVPEAPTQIPIYAAEVMGAAALAGAATVALTGGETSIFEKAQEVAGDLSLAKGRLFRRRSSLNLKDVAEFETDTAASRTAVQQESDKEKIFASTEVPDFQTGVSTTDTERKIGKLPRYDFDFSRSAQRGKEDLRYREISYMPGFQGKSISGTEDALVGAATLVVTIGADGQPQTVQTSEIEKSLGDVRTTQPINIVEGATATSAAENSKTITTKQIFTTTDSVPVIAGTSNIIGTLGDEPGFSVVKKETVSLSTDDDNVHVEETIVSKSREAGGVTITSTTTTPSDSQKGVEKVTITRPRETQEYGVQAGDAEDVLISAAAAAAAIGAEALAKKNEIETVPAKETTVTLIEGESVDIEAVEIETVEIETVETETVEILQSTEEKDVKVEVASEAVEVISAKAIELEEAFDIESIEIDQDAEEKVVEDVTISEAAEVISTKTVEQEGELDIKTVEVQGKGEVVTGDVDQDVLKVVEAAVGVGALLVGEEILEERNQVQAVERNEMEQVEGEGVAELEESEKIVESGTDIEIRVEGEDEEGHYDIVAVEVEEDDGDLEVGEQFLALRSRRSSYSVSSVELDEEEDIAVVDEIQDGHFDMEAVVLDEEETEIDAEAGGLSTELEAESVARGDFEVDDEEEVGIEKTIEVQEGVSVDEGTVLLQDNVQEESVVTKTTVVREGVQETVIETEIKTETVVVEEDVPVETEVVEIFEETL